MAMWRENLFFGNLSEIFRTDGRKFFGRTTDGCTEIFRTDGRKFFIRPDGRKFFGRPDAWASGRPDARTDGRTNQKKTEKFEVCLKR